ncbi:MAG: hypothetical protein LBG66_00500 [Gallionellaceae bacterium]|jgi:hypothetical protein|nr:hypothetical protein [Gallionellaceae bacterium]
MNADQQDKDGEGQDQQPPAEERKTGSPVMVELDAWGATLLAFRVFGYITQEDAERFFNSLPESGEWPAPDDSPRAIFDWLTLNRYTDTATGQTATEQLLVRLRDRKLSPDQIRLVNVIRKLDPRIERALARHNRGSLFQFFALCCGVLAVVGGGIYWLWFADSTPACDARSVKNALSSIGFDVTLKTRIDSAMQPDQKIPFVSFSQYTEVGYDKENHTRACKADIVLDAEDANEQVGYIVMPDKDSSSGYAVKTMPVEFLEARYAGAALNKNLGQPVGREAIQAAVMAGLNELDRKVSARSPGLFGRDDDKMQTLAGSVSSVLPTADCRQLSADRYSCPVQIEYKDPLLAALSSIMGPPYKLLKAEFVFERNGDGWKVGDDFDETFSKVIAGSRVVTSKKRRGGTD